jgi:hypothetical protein
VKQVLVVRARGGEIPIAGAVGQDVLEELGLLGVEVGAGLSLMSWWLVQLLQVKVHVEGQVVGQQGLVVKWTHLRAALLKGRAS